MKPWSWLRAAIVIFFKTSSPDAGKRVAGNAVELYAEQVKWLSTPQWHLMLSLLVTLIVGCHSTDGFSRPPHVRAQEFSFLDLTEPPTEDHHRFSPSPADSLDGPWHLSGRPLPRSRGELPSLYCHDHPTRQERPPLEVDPHAPTGSARATPEAPGTPAEPGYKLLHGAPLSRRPRRSPRCRKACSPPRRADAARRSGQALNLRRIFSPGEDDAADRRGGVAGRSAASLENGATVEDGLRSRRELEPAEEKLCWRMMDPSRIDA
jgi:hypothetical protein